MKNNRLLYILVSLLIIWCIGLTVYVSKEYTTSESQTINKYNITGFSTDFTKIVEESSPSIVSINNNGIVSSGFVYTQEDDTVYVLTSYHGVADSNSLMVYFKNGFNTIGEVVGYDAFLDLAVLKINSPYLVEPLKIGNASLISSGEFVISIGTPISTDYSNSVELGMVSKQVYTISNSINIDIEKHDYYLDVIQLSANLKPGYSGSPIINMNGEAIGLLTMNIDKGINFAITINETRMVADSIIKGEQINRKHIGIKGSYVNDMPMFERSNLNFSVETTYGLYVQNVLDNSFAHQADIKQGDVILSINGNELNSFVDYLNIEYSNTEYFEFVILREGETLTSRIDINNDQNN